MQSASIWTRVAVSISYDDNLQRIHKHKINAIP